LFLKLKKVRLVLKIKKPKQPNKACPSKTIIAQNFTKPWL
jgi:hypothetical protein